MRRVSMFLVLLVSLAVSVIAPPTASAAMAITIEEPTLVTPTSALLTGTATNINSVRVDAWVVNRWTVQNSGVPVVEGRYDVVVPASMTPTRYRVVYGMVKSPEVVVVGSDGPLPEPEPPGPSDACGPQPKKPDGTYWGCTLAEDFNGTELDRSVWMPQTIFRTGSPTAWACYIDDPSVISVHDGVLDLTVRRLPAAAPCAGQGGATTKYVSGMVTTYHLFSQQYGRFEARIKNRATSVPGLQEAFWLWPDDRVESTVLWPEAGEIDIAETYSQYPNLAVPFLHYTANDNGGPVPGLNTSWTCAAKRGVYNTFTLEWTADRIEIFVNGTSCLVNTSGDPAFMKPYIIALTQLLGQDQNAWRWNTPLPATMSVDYVRVWE